MLINSGHASTAVARLRSSEPEIPRGLSDIETRLFALAASCSPRAVNGCGGTCKRLVARERRHQPTLECARPAAGVIDGEHVDPIITDDVEDAVRKAT